MGCVDASALAEGDPASESGTHLVQNCDQLAFADSELSVLVDPVKIVQDPCLHPVAQNGHREEGDGKRNGKENLLLEH